MLPLRAARGRFRHSPDVLERRAILNALEYTKGDRAIAAHLLGIGRTTLYRKLKEYANRQSDCHHRQYGSTAVCRRRNAGEAR